MKFVCTYSVELLIVKTNNSKIQVIPDSSLSVNLFFFVMSFIRFTIPILIFVDTILRLYFENPRTLGKKNGSRYLKGGEERISTLLRSLFLLLIQMAFLRQKTLGVSLSAGYLVEADDGKGRSFGRLMGRVGGLSPCVSGKVLRPRLLTVALMVAGMCSQDQ